MFRIYAVLGLALTVSLPAVFGQNREVPPPYRGVYTDVGGVFVTPVPGIPFSAVVQIKSTQVLPNGTSITRRTVANIARDSQGRIYNEKRALMPAGYDGIPPLLSSHIYDPQTRQSVFLNTMTHIAQERTLNQPTATDSATRSVAPPSPGTSSNAANFSKALQNAAFQQEDLGTETIEGVPAHGIRQSRSVIADVNPGKPNVAIVVSDETWYSDDLHMNMLVKHNDPRTGVQTITLTEIKRAEPDPAIFRIPPDYKAVDITPPVN